MTNEVHILLVSSEKVDRVCQLGIEVVHRTGSSLVDECLKSSVLLKYIIAFVTALDGHIK